MSTFREVSCRVPRALSLILSDLSLDENSGGILIKGVDVTNPGGRVNTRGDRMRTQSGPDRLECWVKNNKTRFNRPTCKVWLLRAKKQMANTRSGGDCLGRKSCEKYLRLLNDQQLRIRQQCDVLVTSQHNMR